jgi:nuclear GTP-binding protein
MKAGTSCCLVLLCASRCVAVVHVLALPQAAARIVLQDWNEGRIPYYTVPPTERPNQEFDSAEIVTAWASEFDADK